MKTFAKFVVSSMLVAFVLAVSFPASADNRCSKRSASCSSTTQVVGNYNYPQDKTWDANNQGANGGGGGGGGGGGR